MAKIAIELSHYKEMIKAVEYLADSYGQLYEPDHTWESIKGLENEASEILQKAEPAVAIDLATFKQVADSFGYSTDLIEDSWGTIDKPRRETMKRIQALIEEAEGNK